MAVRSLRNALLGAGLLNFLALAAGTPSAHGQTSSTWRQCPCPCPAPPVPGLVPPPPGGGYPPSGVPGMPPQAQPPTAPTQPQQTPAAPTQPAPTPEQPTPQPGQGQLPSLGMEQAAATGGETAALASAAVAAPGGYLDNPIPMTTFRVRYDAATNMNRPDRAEFFYGEWGELAFHPHPLGNRGVFFDANARGPTQSPDSVNFQIQDTYLEYAINHRVSAFVDIPIRWVHFGTDVEDPDERIPGTNQFFFEPNRGATESVSSNNGGLSDIQAGFKAALVANPNQFVTFQFRTYIPTGNVSQGLGTGHVSLEPGLLLYQRLADRLFLQGQSTFWIPVGGGLAAGDIFTYGLGIGYNVFQRGSFFVTPITELLGWTVLSGYESVFNGQFSPTVPLATPGGPVPTTLALPTTHGVVAAAGDTIINLKLGARVYFGRASSVYAGWGHALTGDRWYKDILRVEYRYAF